MRAGHVRKEPKARVGVVSMEPLRSLGLVAILDEHTGLEASALAMEEVFGAEGLAVLLLDTRAPLDLLIQTITRLRRDRPAVKVVVMGEPLDREQLQMVIGAGAKGFLVETAGVSEIGMAIDIVLDGSIWAPRKVLANLVEAGTTSSAINHGGSSEPIEEMLTEREREVLQLLMNGRSNREIASAMGIESVTVKAHLGRMLRKTRSANRVELTLRAMEQRGASSMEEDEM